MSKDIMNQSGAELQDNTYYTVQYGLILAVGYFHQDIWYITGFESIPSQKLRNELIVVQKLFTQDELAKDLQITVAA